MQVIIESLGDPIWQIGAGTIALVALVLIFVLRSPDFRLSPWQQWFLPRIIGLVCLSIFLVLSAGVVLSHGADAAPTSVHATRSHPSVTATPPVIPSPTQVPTPTPSPFPHLSPTPAQVLTTISRCHRSTRSEWSLGAVLAASAKGANTASTSTWLVQDRGV